MYDRFPELRNLPKGVPPEDGFLDGLFFLGWLCTLVYVIPTLALALSATGLKYASNAMSIVGLAVCFGAPLVWAIMVPGGLWYLVIPIISPAALLCYIVYASYLTEATEP